MRRFTGREVGAFFVSLLGILVLGSALLMNPWVARAFQGAQAIDRLDVLGAYFVWALAIGVGILVLATQLAKSPRLDGVGLLLLMGAGVLLADRFLLARLGLPLWEYDAELKYRHRPNAVRSVDPINQPDRLFRINAYGHHDDDFPLEKPAGELRGLLLGDSVTMGYGVTRHETFAAALETRLEDHDRRHPSHQVINTGVHGYSTSQELIVFRDGLRFSPDYVAVGFCMNDVTEPFIVDADLGGTGLDYHAVSQTPSPVLGWILNETGVGRVLQRLQSRGKTLEAERLQEAFDVRAMATGSRTTPRFQEAWAYVLGSLDGIYALAEQEEQPLVLMIFPFVFQLNGSEDTRLPQAILTEHAKRHGIDVIDFTPILRDAIYDDPELLALMRANGYSDEEIELFFSWKIREYFLDEDHLTPRGHELVALHLARWLQRRGLVELPEAATSTAGTTR